MRSTRRMAALAAAVFMTTLLITAGTATADDVTADIPDAPAVPDVEPTQLTIGTVVEAWYQLTGVNTCGTPAGCLLAQLNTMPTVPSAVPLDVPAVSPYPADSLHVGFIGAVETARTYIKLDLSSLPDGAQVSEGELTLPVDTRPTAGTIKPENAQMKACLATSGFHNQVGGSLATAPKMDCGTSSPLSYGGGKFRVDLGPFMEAWADGAENFGIAITPFKVPDPTLPFQVAFPASGATKLPHIGGLLAYQLESVADGAEEVIDDAAPAAGPTFQWIGPSAKKTVARQGARTAPAPQATNSAVAAVATEPPSNWTWQIVAILAALAAMGGVYEMTRRRMRKYAF